MPEDALLDIDPTPAALREKDLTSKIHDKGRRPELLIDDLLKLAELYIDDRRFEEALKLFDINAAKKLGIFKMLPARNQSAIANS